MRRFLAFMLMGLWSVSGFAQISVGQIWNRAKSTVQSSSAEGSGLTDSRISAGLKEALTISTGNAVATTGKTDGFFKNKAIKILLPNNLKKVGDEMRLVGMSAPVDKLELGMNRAAEQATPQAKQIFLDALTKMTFADARQILTGEDTAATEYFRRTSSEQLTEAFKPIVHQALENVGVVQQYNRVVQSAAFGTFVHNKADFNLDDYVVSKTLDGLFFMLGQEEKKIRTNPAAQTTALLKQVFGPRIRQSSEGQ